MAKRTLPDYENPPVIETVLGVEFAPLKAWSVPHFGLFWKELPPEYATFEVQPSLASQIEQFDSMPQIQGVSLEFGTPGDVRCWFAHKNKQALVQVQSSHFIYNWRKQGDTPYPHYDESIRPTFKTEWERFLAFVKKHDLGEVRVLQCEVTYVNHLPKDVGWTNFAELSKVTRYWSQPSSAGRFLPDPERVGVTCAFRMPENQGRLHVRLNHAIRTTDGTEILQLNLTARGKPASQDTSAILEWMDKGREWVVKGFDDFTSPHMHQIWKRKS